MVKKFSSTNEYIYQRGYLPVLETRLNLAGLSLTTLESISM
jgi:hypothetical protein